MEQKVQQELLLWLLKQEPVPGPDWAILVSRELGYSFFHLAENVEKIFGSVKFFQMFQHGFVLISSFVRRSRCESGKTGIQFFRIVYLCNN